LITAKGTAACAAALFFCGTAAAQGPPRRCALVCPPDQQLNIEKCVCEAPMPIPHPICTLVCPTPGQMLDAELCRCIPAR